MLKARYRRILRFFSRVLLHLGWWDILLPRIGFAARSQKTRPERLRKIAMRYRQLAVDLGGVLIKVGQWLSARLDVLPSEITNELSHLQDEVQPEDYNQIRCMIETEFDQPQEMRFEFVNPQPVAAASIGQVHSARLRLEEENAEDKNLRPPVVIKVQRPNIEQIVATDLAALQRVGRWLQLYRPIRRHVDVPALLREFSQTLYEEIDYLHEGKNAEIFAENFTNVEDVRVPAVYWPFTTRRVLTLEDVQGIKITDYAAIDAAGIDRKQVALRLFDIYLKQIFEDRFFHADPHPGNLFVLPKRETADSEVLKFQIVFVDFGMAGRITDNILSGLRELVIAVAQRDATRVVKAYQTMRVLLPNADIELLTKANQRAFERFWGKSTTELMELGPEEALDFLDEFRSLLFNNPFQLPDDMILLGRCLTILNGICTGLDPEFNVWQSVLPWADKLVADEGRDQWKFWLGETVDTLRSVVSLPRRAENLISRMEQGRLEMRSPELNLRIQRIERSIDRLAAALCFAALLLAGVQLYLSGATILAAGIGLTAMIALLAALFR